MAEIVNLKRTKKARARRAADETAAANRTKFGTPKAARKLAKAKREQEVERIDAHKLGDD